MFFVRGVLRLMKHVFKGGFKLFGKSLHEPNHMALFSLAYITLSYYLCILLNTCIFSLQGLAFQANKHFIPTQPLYLLHLTHLLQ